VRELQDEFFDAVAKRALVELDSKGEPCLAHFICQALFIGRFEEPRPKMAMHLDGTP
jgi:hypothetical protein